MKVTLRILMKNRHFTAINLCGLVIGITSFIIIISWVRHELSYDSFHTKADRIYQLIIKHPQGIFDPNTPYTIAPALANTYPEVETFTHVYRYSTISNSSFKFFPDSVNQLKSYEPEVVGVSSNFFDIFDFKIFYGNRKELLERPGSVVISSDIAQTYFGDINPVGHTIQMNNSRLLTITGVAEIPENTYFNFDFFLLNPENLASNWNWRDPSYLLLRPDIDLENFRNKIRSFVDENMPWEHEGSFELQIIPIKKSYLTFTGTQKVYIFSFIAFLLLVLAAMNYMNLASANYVNRIKESGIRKALGAGKRSLRKIIFTETYILAFTATIISLFLSEIILLMSKQFFAYKLEIGYLSNPLILLIIFGSVFIILTVSSAYPSSLFMRGNALNTDKKTYSTGRKGQLFILLTVILQFTLTITLLISAFVIKDQVDYAVNEDLGFSVENVLSIPMNDEIADNFEVFLERMESYPGIEKVTVGKSIPYDEDSKTNIQWLNNSTEEENLFRYSICLRNYPGLFEMKPIAGRLFSDDIETDLGKYVVNETAASLFGFEEPVGEYITMWGSTGEIIGVVEDFHHVSLHREILPHIFNVNPMNYDALRFIFIKISPENINGKIEFINSVFDELAGNFPFTYSLLEDEIDQLYRKDMNLVKIIGIFVFLTIILSVLSIYGLAYHSIEKNTKEITIRKVFGASLQNNLALTYRKILAQIGFSLLIAIPLSIILMNSWLSNFAYSIKPKPVHFIISLLIAFFVAAITTTLAMWRTLNRNPIENLKHN